MRALLLLATVLIAGCAAHSSPAPAPPVDGAEAERRWKAAPPLEHSAFWKDASLIVTRPADGRIQLALVPILPDDAREVAALPARDYKAIPLEAYLASRPVDEVGSGEHLVVTNIRGERIYLTRAEIAERRPVIVIGIDDERNLYRSASSYRLERSYSWRAGAAPPPMIRPAGPFLFFPDGPPPEVNDLAAFGLKPASFRFVKEDPLAAVRGLSPELREALVGRDGCLHCHSLRTTGARAFHVRASDGKPDGGIALPLDEYPSPVLQRFLFDQATVAAGFGVEPLPIPASAATALYELVRSK